MGKFYIESLGCAKNQVDSEVLLHTLQAKGWTYVGQAEAADLIIVNSCGFIQPAKEESIETVLSFREAYPDKKVLLAGCFAQRYGNELSSQLPEADGIFGNHDLRQIAVVSQQVMQGQRPVALPDWQYSPAYRSELFSFPGSAYVKISEGCNHRCSFCAIPLIRGPLKSIPIEDILRQIRELLQRGVVEINLIAQDLAAYGSERGNPEFPLLLRKISELSGDFWIRLLYIHPDNFPIEILSIMKDDPRIIPYFDIPFQHAAKRVLRRMGRSGTAAEYLRLIDRIRGELPAAVIRSTLMVGFPGEGPREFKELQKFQQDARFDWAGVFVFSREEGTRAFSMRSTFGDRLIAGRAQARKNVLEELQTRISSEQMDRFVDRSLRVLVEEKVAEESMALGRAYLHAPEVDGTAIILSDSLAPGSWTDMRVVKRNNFDLEVVPQNELV
ncbi:MAG: 30S ribosomal protein S12 methylthiotransferase RimO [bacterium]